MEKRAKAKEAKEKEATEKKAKQQAAKEAKETYPLVFPVSKWTAQKEKYGLEWNKMSIQSAYAQLSNPSHKKKAIHVYENGLGFCGTCEWSYGCYQCDFVKTLRCALRRERAWADAVEKAVEALKKAASSE